MTPLPLGILAGSLPSVFPSLNDFTFTTFDTFTGFSAQVDAIAVQSNGRILAGGAFTTYNGTTANRIVRFNADTSVDASFVTESGFNAQVNALAIQSDGKIIAGGIFTAYNGTTANQIARLNTDGSFDFSFNTGTGFNSTVFSIAIQSDGKIVVGGAFTTYNGVTANRIIRLNTDGSMDSSFSIGTGFDSNIVNRLAIQSDGKIVVVGGFTAYNGTVAPRIARLNTDGSFDFSFNIGAGFNSNSFSLAIQSDGKIVVGGAFTTYNGVTSNRIIRLNTNGSIDSSFSIGTGFTSNVLSILIQSDGRILAGGEFTGYAGNARNRIIRLNTDGSIDSSFSIGTGVGSSRVNAIAIQSNGRIVVGGQFNTYNNNNAGSLVELDANGTLNNSYITGGFVNGNVTNIAMVSNDGLVVGGSFTGFNNVTRNRIVGLSANGSINTGFSVGTGSNRTPEGILAAPNGTVYISNVTADTFTYNGLTRGGIIAINSNGTPNSSFVYQIDIGDSDTDEADIQLLAVDSSSRLLVRQQDNDFSAVPGEVLRINTNGTIDTSFVTNGFDARSAAIQSDGRIIFGGSFSAWGGTNIGVGIVRVNTNGTRDTSFNSGTGFSPNPSIRAIRIQSDGKIVVGGNFTTYNGTTANRIVRLNTDGSLDTSFVTGTGFNFEVNALAIQSDGKIVAGGIFTTYNGVTANRIVRLNTDGSLDTSFVTGTGFNGVVNRLAIQSDGKIVVGGTFSGFNGIPRGRIARLHPLPVVPA